MSNTNPFPSPGPLGGPTVPGGGAPMGAPMGGGLPNAPRPDVDTDKKKGKGDKKATRRVVGTNRIAAIALAALTGVMLLVAVGGGGEPETYVVRTIEPVSALSTVAVDQVEVIPVPENLVEAGAFTGAGKEELLEQFLADTDGLKTISALSAGEQVHSADFSEELDLGARLKPNERLMSIEAEVPAAVAGVLRPGDQVDVVATVGNVTNIVARKVPIVAIRPSARTYEDIAADQSGDDESNPDELLPATPVPGQYIVRVDAQLAVDLSAAQAEADRLTFLFLGSDSTEMQTVPSDLAALICGVDQLCLDRLNDLRTSGGGVNPSTAPEGE